MHWMWNIVSGELKTNWTMVYIQLNLLFVEYQLYFIFNLCH